MNATFEYDCESLCEELTAYAERTRPDWSSFPTTRDRSKLPGRFEVNKRIKDSSGGTLICQYEFTRERIAVALYLTMLGHNAESACDALDRGKVVIEQHLASKSSWTERAGKRVRFSVSAMSFGEHRTVNYSGDARVPHLVDLMWRFQEVTFPLIGF